MYSQIAIIFALIASASASYLAGPLAAPLAPVAPVALHAPSFTTSAHVGNVQSASRSYSNVPQSRFQRTDWIQPGSLLSSPVFAEVRAPTYGTIAVPGPTKYTQFLTPRAPLVENSVHYQHGVALAPTVAAVPVAAPAYPVAAAPAYAAPAFAAPAPAYPAPAAAPVAVKGY